MLNKLVDKMRDVIDLAPKTETPPATEEQMNFLPAEAANADARRS